MYFKDFNKKNLAGLFLGFWGRKLIRFSRLQIFPPGFLTVGAYERAATAPGAAALPAEPQLPAQPWRPSAEPETPAGRSGGPRSIPAPGQQDVAACAGIRRGIPGRAALCVRPVLPRDGGSQKLQRSEGKKKNTNPKPKENKSPSWPQRRAFSPPPRLPPDRCVSYSPRCRGSG